MDTPSFFRRHTQDKYLEDNVEYVILQNVARDKRQPGHCHCEEKENAGNSYRNSKGGKQLMLEECFRNHAYNLK